MVLVVRSSLAVTAVSAGICKRIVNLYDPTSFLAGSASVSFGFHGLRVLQWTPFRDKEFKFFLLIAPLVDCLVFNLAPQQYAVDQIAQEHLGRIKSTTIYLCLPILLLVLHFA